MKYSNEKKLAVVLSVLQGEHSIYSAVSHFGVSRTLLQHWVARYERHGSAGLQMRHGSYKGDFKLSVITYMHENHLSLTQTAVEFGIPQTCTVLNWDRIYRQEGAGGLYRDNRGRKKMKGESKKLPDKELTEHEQLLRENELLRAENAYLKKLQALVEERIARESGSAQKPSKD